MPAETLALYHAPYNFPALLQHFAARAIDGIEQVTSTTYTRSIALNGQTGSLTISNNPAQNALTVEITFPDPNADYEVLRRVRQMFDLDAEPEQIRSQLSRDPALASVLANDSGPRAPGNWDPFELAVRAILGQQITLAAARRLGAQIVRLCGRSTFPDARSIVEADLSLLGIPQARKNTLKALGQTALEDPHLFDTVAPLDTAVERLRAIPGIGEWTAQYIALRALRQMDAFPATDVAILRGAAKLTGRTLTPTELLALAEQWRPWRGYAAQYLWSLSANA